MRVLMISKACVVGSYQKKLEELARLPDMELTVVVPPYWRDRAWVQPLERRHTTGYELAVERMAFNGNYHLHFYPRLGRRVRHVQPDLVHIDEEPYNLATAQGLWWARRLGACTLFFSWQNLNRRYPLPFRLLERYVLSRTDGAIVGNEASAQVWKAKGYRGPVTVIPQFGVDPDLFSPSPAGAARRQSGAEFIVGFCGRLVEEKGADLLIEALASLAGPWQAVLVGDGPALPALRAQARRLGISDRVGFAGRIPSSEMPATYRQFDVLVLPSRSQSNWKEQFGRALVEAMACGVPVIGSDSGEIPHVVGEAGLIFPEGEVEALRARLAELMGAPTLRAELARSGRERVLAHFTQAQVAARTYQFYRQILGPRAE